MPSPPPLDYIAPSRSERRAAFARAFRRWFFRILLAATILGTIAVTVDQVWVWHWRRIVISPDTTQITAPIEPSGCPDYLAVLNAKLSAGVTAENNAAPLLLQIIGTRDTPAALQAAVHKSFGFDPAPLPGQIVTLLESRTADAAATRPTFEQKQAAMEEGIFPPELHAGVSVNEQKQAAMEEEGVPAAAPWNPADHPDWAAWIKANGPALDNLHAAVTRTHFYAPTVSKTGALAGLGEEMLISTNLLPIGRYRQLAGISLAHAMMHLHNGNADGFRKDILATAKLARLVAKGHTLLEYLVARAIDEKASLAVQLAGSYPSFHAGQVETLTREFASLAPFPAPIAQLDIGDRFTYLDAICKLARNTESDPLIGKVRWMPVNFNYCLRTINGQADEMVAAWLEPTHARRKTALVALASRQTVIYNSSRRIERAIFGIVFQDLSRAEWLYTQNLAQRSLALTALGLRAHKLRNGAFPALLADLPKEPAGDPTDYFIDKPLVYRTTVDGYILYSLGPNQVDDGGAPKAPGPAATSYDLVIKVAK